MLANNSKIEGNDTAVACADHSSHHLPHHHLRSHHHRFSSPLQSHLAHNHYREQHYDPQHQHQHQRYHAFKQSTESATPPHNNSSSKSSSSSPGITILSSSSPLSLPSSSFTTATSFTSSYSYSSNPPQRYALPSFHNNGRLDRRTGPSSSLPPHPLVAQTHSFHPPTPSPLPLSTSPPPNSRPLPPVWPTIAALPTPAPNPDAVTAASTSPSASPSLSLPKRAHTTTLTTTTTIMADMDIDDTMMHEGGRPLQHSVEREGREGGEYERIEQKSDSSSAMDQCEPQRDWSPSSSLSSQHSSSPSSPVMTQARSVAPARIMKRHSYSGHNEDTIWRGDQDRQRRFARYGHGHDYEYYYSDERQGGKGGGGVLSTASHSLRAFARSQSEHRPVYRPELAEGGQEGGARKEEQEDEDEDKEGEQEDGEPLWSHRRKHARVARTDPFPRARGAMATAATLDSTPRAAGAADAPARKSLVPIDPNHTIQRDRKHHSWPLVAHPAAASPVGLVPLHPHLLPSPPARLSLFSSHSSLAVSVSSSLPTSPPASASDVAMAVAVPRTVISPLPMMAPYPRRLSGSNLLKRRQSSPTPSPSMRRVPSFGYMSEAQRTLYERHPPSPSPPFSPPGLLPFPPAGAATFAAAAAAAAAVTPPSHEVGAQRSSSLSLSPASLRSPKVESVQESNSVHGNNNAQTPMYHRLPPISKDGYLQGYEQDEHEQEADHRTWYDCQQQQQQQQHQLQKHHHHDLQQHHRPTKFLPRIKAPPTDDICRPREQLIEPPLYSSSSSSSGSSNHSFSAESSISPTYPPSTYLPPHYSSSFSRSTSLAQPVHSRHGQAPQQQQHSMYRDSYPPPQHQPLEQGHVLYEHRSAAKQQPQHLPTHTSHSWGHHNYRSSSSTLDQRSTFIVPPPLPHQQTYHLQQQQHRHPGQRPSSMDYRTHGHQSYHSAVHRSSLHPSLSAAHSAASSSSSSSLRFIKNKAEGAIMVFNPQTESMTFKCELCPFESFGRIHDLKRHQTSKHKEMTWPCDFCHRPFVRRDALLRHYTVKAARDDGLHPASHEVEKLLEARARAKMLY